MPPKRDRAPLLRSFDATISVAQAGDDHVVVGKRLAELSQKFVFQKERSDSGYLHYQCRIRVRKQVRLANFVTAHGADLWGGHISATSAEVHEAQNFNYVMKADTRVGGPWKDSEFALDQRPPLTWQLENFMKHKMHPWQEDMERLVQQRDDRTVTLIHDDVGCTGKSRLIEYLAYKGLGRSLPQFDKREDIMAAVMAAPDRMCFFMDLPRGMPKHDLNDIFAGCEIIKDGMAYDKRYKFRMERFGCPQVFVFSNRMPYFQNLSQDRWRIYTIRRELTLARLEVHQAVELQRLLDKQAALRAEDAKANAEARDAALDLRNVDLLSQRGALAGMVAGAPDALGPGGGGGDAGGGDAAAGGGDGDARPARTWQSLRPAPAGAAISLESEDDDSTLAPGAVAEAGPDGDRALVDEVDEEMELVLALAREDAKRQGWDSDEHEQRARADVLRMRSMAASPESDRCRA